MGKLSLISRFLVYTFDFANARNKLGYLKGSASFAGFPLWLVFHHGGVFITHAIVALFVEAQTLFHCAVMLLVLQSTHNTWTKKYSYTMYWGNVLVGVLCTYVYAALNWQNAVWACGSIVAMMSIINTGIALLFVESVLKKSEAWKTMRSHLQWTLKLFCSSSTIHHVQQ